MLIVLRGMLITRADRVRELMLTLFWMLLVLEFLVLRVLGRVGLSIRLLVTDGLLLSVRRLLRSLRSGKLLMMSRLCRSVGILLIRRY